MAYSDLHDFIDKLEEKQLIKRISAEVNAELEISEITDRVVKRGGPALLFENVRNSRFPLFINAFGSFERMNIALGIKDIEQAAHKIGDFLDAANYAGFLKTVKSVPNLVNLASVFPIKLPTKGKCQQIIDYSPDLGKLPILKCWPLDGGKFITLPIVITKDPETGVQNMGMYRMQVYDAQTTGMHWHLHKDGRDIYEKYMKTGGIMPVSIALGCDPVIIYSATAPLPQCIDEILFAGFLRRKPVSLVKSITNDIYVPANADFILEGYVDTSEELRPEGPFGDHTGYYSLTDLYPVFHLTCITCREDAIYPATIVGKPPMEDCFLGKATERLFLPMLKLQFPEIIDINFPIEGVFHNCVIVTIKKRYPGHARKVMNSIWGSGQMMYTKMIVVVDEEVNPHDLSTVAWKVFNNIDAKRDVVLSEGPLDALDHASNQRHYGCRIGVDATVKYSEEGYTRTWPDEICMQGHIKELVTKRWREYGF
jgi:4-hydroxy-3-polyprenylbenzoate decarboxylase